MESTTKKQKRIWVSDDHARTLREEFQVSNVTVLLALKFASYSFVAKAIRERAMELITQSLKDSENLMNDFHQ